MLTAHQVDTMADPPPAPGKKSGLTCWLLDTRTLWPGKSIAASAEVRTTLHLLGPPGCSTCHDTTHQIECGITVLEISSYAIHQN